MAIVCIIQISSQELDNLLPPKSASRYLWEEQKKAMKVKDRREIRWSPVILRWCTATYHKWPAAYNLIKESGMLVLPAQSTLHDYTCYTEAKTGTHENVLEQMVKDMDYVMIRPILFFCLMK